MSRRVGRVLLAAAATAALVGLPSGATLASDSSPSATTPIRHVVVMTQDAHSFDNYLGSRGDLDGIPPDVCLPVKTTSDIPCRRPFPLVPSGLKPRLDPSAAAMRRAVADGRMNGFVVAQTTPRLDGRAALGFYRPSDVPVLTQLTRHGVLFDRWFSSVPGGSIANRLFAMSGAVVRDTDLVPADGWADLPVIFDRLQEAGITWKVYVEHYEPALTITVAGLPARRGGQVARVPLLALPRYEQDASLMAHIRDLDDYYRDLARGTLPAVSWIVTTAATERPPADPTIGQRAVRNVANALAQSSAWRRSAFMLTYDSSGGWYDHVPPPTVRGHALGLRVPAVLVSPYARPGRVDHHVFDSASVLRFIETNWGLRPLTDRDAHARDLATAFDFDREPHAATIIGTTGDRPPPPRLSALVIFGGYLVALLVAAASCVWAAGRRPAAASQLARERS